MNTTITAARVDWLLVHAAGLARRGDRLGHFETAQLAVAQALCRRLVAGDCEPVTGAPPATLESCIGEARDLALGWDRKSRTHTHNELALVLCDLAFQLDAAPGPRVPEHEGLARRDMCWCLQCGPSAGAW